MGLWLLVPGPLRPMTSAVLARRTSLLRVAALPSLLDGRDELALAHPRGPGNALGLGDPLKLGQQHPGKSARLAASGTGSARTGPVGRTGRVIGIRQGAYRAVWLVGSPARRRHAGGLTTRFRQLSREQVQGFAHKGSFPGCGSRPRGRSCDARCRVVAAASAAISAWPIAEAGSCC